MFCHALLLSKVSATLTKVHWVLLMFFLGVACHLIITFCYYSTYFTCVWVMMVSCMFCQLLYCVKRAIAVRATVVWWGGCYVVGCGEHHDTVCSGGGVVTHFFSRRTGWWSRQTTWFWHYGWSDKVLWCRITWFVHNTVLTRVRFYMLLRWRW